MVAEKPERARVKVLTFVARVKRAATLATSWDALVLLFRTTM
jgi:hypothetical protein